MSGPAFVQLLASTWIVRADGTGDFPTIADAVAAATDGDEVLLADGTFSGSGNRNVDFGGKAITVRSETGQPGACIVDCDRHIDPDPCNGNVAFLFRNGEDAGSVLADLTIVRATRRDCDGAWAAIDCRKSSPTIRNVTIRECDLALYSGNASPLLEDLTLRENRTPTIYCYLGAPTIRGCLLEANSTAVSSGFGTVALYQSSATIESCRIEGNGLTALPYLGGGISIHEGAPLVRECVIAGNSGYFGGLYVVNASPTIERCTLTRNEADVGGGIRVYGASFVTMTQTIVWGNCAPVGAEIRLDSAASTIEVACVDLRQAGVSGPGSLVPAGDLIDADPLFCDAIECADAPLVGGIYELATRSPALTQDCGPMGALPGGCFISVEPLSWGGIKAKYR